MITEKQIEEAARMHTEKESEAKGFDSSKPYHLAYAEGNVVGFQAGAHWAIQEFLKGLWHDASEEPKGHNPACLLEVEIEAAEELSNSIDFVESWYMEHSWSTDYLSVLDDAEGVSYEIKRWLYIDDLFPKQEGGNNE